MFRRALLLSLFALAALADSPNLRYSTILGSDFNPAGIAADSAGNVYIAANGTPDTTNNRTSIVMKCLRPDGSEIYTRTIAVTGSISAGSLAVDASGDAFLVGGTTVPDFQPNAGTQLGAAPTGPADARSFLMKLDKRGTTLWSTFLGGSALSSAQAVALNADGNILVSGISDANFPSTPGAYNVADTKSRPYLLEVDAAGKRLLFSATGIGGTSIALDPTGNVFVAGSTRLLDYPTTAGAYQEKFYIAIQWVFCLGPSCFGGFQGVNQYVTKVDPSGSKLLYSTALSNQKDFGGQIVNRGLAVDVDGNAYLTGIAWDGGDYPFTAPLPKGIAYPSFLTKLDAAGKNVVFSVPLGGAGVNIGASGELYAGGSYNNFNARQYLNLGPAALQTEDPPPGVSDLPAACRVNNVTSAYQAYVSKVDPITGIVLASRMIDASNLTNLGIALAGNNVWLAGITLAADTPFTPGALDMTKLGKGPFAYLGSVDFGSFTTGAQISCVTDGADIARISSVALNQVLTIFGSNLAGSAVTFDDVAGTVLYDSPSQVNIVVPRTVSGQTSTILRVSPGNAIEVPITAQAPSLFADLSNIEADCVNCFRLVARNSDGTVNSRDNPAQIGSVVSIYLNDARDATITASVEGNPAQIISVKAENAYVTRADIQLPVAAILTAQSRGISINVNGAAAGPSTVTSLGGTVNSVNSTSFTRTYIPPGIPFYTYVWATP